ncbi:hypothetical protein NDU88_008105 [Pleurodeles waltl]|uniref:Uncharacterized protein n=1 Tax=Pleurodeles waltl TaxID=8319 RepID=A0AAV7NV85_PLEWA|nr:hypothetical protein NDU88_008105 [Pleurodeles waltl]
MWGYHHRQTPHQVVKSPQQSHVVSHSELPSPCHLLASHQGFQAPSPGGAQAAPAMGKNARRELPLCWAQPASERLPETKSLVAVVPRTGPGNALVLLGGGSSNNEAPPPSPCCTAHAFTRALPLHTNKA